VGKKKKKEDLTIDEIINLNDGVIAIQYDRGTGLPYIIRGLFTTRKINSAKDAVKALSSIRSIMRIDQLSFTCTKKEKTEDYRVFYLQQLYKGIMVYGGFFKVTARNTGEPYELIGSYVSGIELDITPELTATEASNNISLHEGRRISETLLVIYTDPEEDVRLSWRYTIVIGDIVYEKYIFVDANTGESLAVVPLIIN
jgi:Zn-dependent metalloprotease